MESARQIGPGGVVNVLPQPLGYLPHLPHLPWLLRPQSAKTLAQPPRLPSPDTSQSPFPRRWRKILASDVIKTASAGIPPVGVNLPGTQLHPLI